jgi:hypothetical protein
MDEARESAVLLYETFAVVLGVDGPKHLLVELCEKVKKGCGKGGFYAIHLRVSY